MRVEAGTGSWEAPGLIRSGFKRVRLAKEIPRPQAFHGSGDMVMPLLALSSLGVPSFPDLVSGRRVARRMHGDPALETGLKGAGIG